MKHLLVKIIINAAALMFTASIIDGIYVDGWSAVIIAAVILGIINAVIRPILMVLTLPLNLMTLTATVVSGFDIMGMWPAIVGAIILSVVSTVLNWLVD